MLSFFILIKRLNQCVSLNQFPSLSLHKKKVPLILWTHLKVGFSSPFTHTHSLPFRERRERVSFSFSLPPPASCSLPFIIDLPELLHRRLHCAFIFQPLTAELARASPVAVCASTPPLNPSRALLLPCTRLLLLHFILLTASTRELLPLWSCPTAVELLHPSPKTSSPIEAATQVNFVSYHVLILLSCSWVHIA